MGGRRDAVVVGAGPNGLAAAVTLARAGFSVLVIERNQTVGGACRSAALTLPGFVHDVCAAILPLAAASPFFAGLPLQRHGLEWIHPVSPLAHPLDDGQAAVLERSIEATGAWLGGDSAAWASLMRPLVEGFEALSTQLLANPLRVPRHPLLLARFGAEAVRSAASFARARFKGEAARALFAGVAAHSSSPLGRPMTVAISLMLSAAGHAVGWPMPRGGAQRLPEALASYLKSLGGEIATGQEVRSLAELPASRVVLLDVSAEQALRIAGERFPPRYRRALERFRRGPGVFKVDFALSGPIPWRAPQCARAGTVHLGGTLEEIAAAEAAVGRGEAPERPFVLLAQHTLFDRGRAPPGRHTAWAYCHVPNGSPVDMRERLEAQIERFAPGFRDLVLARSSRFPADLERDNPSCAGGDIGGGASDGLQLLFRPTLRLDPYATPDPRLFLCSASTPPGAGVHGLCGYLAARSALRRLRRRRRVFGARGAKRRQQVQVA